MATVAARKKGLSIGHTQCNNLFCSFFPSTLSLLFKDVYLCDRHPLGARCPPSHRPTNSLQTHCTHTHKYSVTRYIYIYIWTHVLGPVFICIIDIIYTCIYNIIYIRSIIIYSVLSASRNRWLVGIYIFFRLTLASPEECTHNTYAACVSYYRRIHGGRVCRVIQIACPRESKIFWTEPAKFVCIRDSFWESGYDFSNIITVL